MKSAIDDRRALKVRSRGRTVAVLVGIAAVCGVALVGSAQALPAGCSQVATTVTCTFSSTGSEQSFVVPAGVTSINVTAVGGKGGAGITEINAGGSAGAGGLGATASGTIPVTAGSTLYVEVAGNGQDGTGGAGGAGGFNGGGNGETYSAASSGGGGGASDVRTTSCGGTCPGQPASLATRLLVAAGGGGGGSAFGNTASGNGGAGGAAGSSPQAGTNGTDDPSYPGSGGGGGGAGSASLGGSGGAAGVTSSTDMPGTAGSAGQGGSGQQNGFTQSPGGGGGSGYYGGGGGGSGGRNNDGQVGGGGGGGAGSSFADPSVIGSSIGSDATGVPLVTITYTAPGLQGQDGTSHNAVEGAAMNNATLGTFTDPNTSAVAGDFTATVCWNDGGTPPPNNDCGPATVSGGNGSFTVTGSHTFPEEGSFTAVTSVTGADGSTTLRMPVSVADAPLSATGVKASVPTKKSFTKVVANFTDADPGGTTSDFSATINWGDGSPTTGGLIAPNGLGGWSVSGSHKYAAPGAGYSVTVSITDSGGANTSTTSVFKVNK